MIDRESIDFPAIVQGWFPGPWKASGSGWYVVGLCPYHDDHHPSLAALPVRGKFHCPVCAKSFDVFDLFRDFEGLDFAAAGEMMGARQC